MRKSFFIFILFLIIIAGTGTALYYAYFVPNNNIVPAFDEGKLNLVVEGELDTSSNWPKIVEGEILLPLETVKKYIDANIFWDEGLKKVTITTDKKLIRMKTDSLEAIINNKTMNLKFPVTTDNNVIYIPIEFLSDLYNIELNYLKDNNVIIIDFTTKVKQMAEVIKPISQNAVIRKTQSVRSPILKKFDPAPEKAEDNALRILETYEKWYKVRASDGTIGYMEKRYVVAKDLVVKKLPQEEPVKDTWKPAAGKINLVWEMMYSKRPDLSKINKMDGLDVISPTWFQVANDKGQLINRADAKYVEWAHANGYKVWGLLSNDFNDIKMTKRFLNNTDARDTTIREILAYASLYKLDGINLDFENIYKEDKGALTQFVRELTPLLKEQGLVVSMDVTVPDGSDTWSLCYDRKAIGQIVDYVMLMTYDQHYSTSPKSGSVAQIVWVEKNLQKVLEMVPKEKLLLGLPFYTRLWKEELDKDGKLKVTNQVLAMDAAKKMVKDNNAPVKWDEESGQFYAEFKKDNLNYKVWLEDENSINLKSSLAQKYNLAGAAAWRRSDETAEVWKVLNKNLKGVKSYQAWVDENKEKKYVYN
ncbi:MAG: glycoside hydrolase [Clostridiales bacterium]|nr:glycoside hydrolase [Clostridiales bacterium]